MAVRQSDLSNAMTGENGTGAIYLATDFVASDYETVITGLTTNETIIAAIESTYTFAEVGYFENFGFAYKNGDERVIETSACNVGEVSRKQEKLISVTYDNQEIVDMDNLALMLGVTVETVAAGVGVTGKQIIRKRRGFGTTPYQLIKFVGCPNDEGLVNIVYFVKMFINSDIAIEVIDFSKDDFAGVSLEFETAKGGDHFLSKEVAVATS